MAINPDLPFFSHSLFQYPVYPSNPSLHFFLNHFLHPVYPENPSNPSLHFFLNHFLHPVYPENPSNPSLHFFSHGYSLILES
jgi:hypothetical protein